MKRLLRLLPALLLAASTLRAEEVLILTGEQGPLHDQILSGLRKSLTAGYKELPSAGDIAQAIGPDTRVIVAIGAATADKARAASDLPMVVTGVPNLYDKNWKDVVKVHVDVPAEEQLRVLKALHPAVKTVGMIHTPGKSAELVGRIRQAATAAGLVVVDEPCDSTSAIAAALRGMRDRVDAFWMIMDPIALHPIAVDILFQFSATQKVFLIAPVEPYVQKGADMALTADYAEVGGLAGEAVQAVLKKSARREYFIRQPQLFLNEPALAHLGLQIPAEIRAKVKRLY